MRIQAVNFYNTNVNNRKLRSYQASTPDMFVKSPSFGSSDALTPFFKNKVKYIPENIEKYNKILESLDLKNRTDYLSDSLIYQVKQILSARSDSPHPFCLDFLIRNGNVKDLENIRDEESYSSLPEIRFSENEKENVSSLLQRLGRRYAGYNLYSRALDSENLPLLKMMIEDNNWQGFVYHPLASYQFGSEEYPIIRKGQNSENPEIKALFNDEHLYKLLSQYNNIYYTAIDDYNEFFDFALIFYTQTQDAGMRKMIAENMVYTILDSNLDSSLKSDKISEFPMTEYERELLKWAYNDEKNIIRASMMKRMEKILSKNGSETPEELLNCLLDKSMSQELLELPYNNIVLINRIANIPVNDENKEIISKIITKLSEMRLPDNEKFRHAGITAAKNGNLELLKLFESKHIHFINNLNEPISNFPENVQQLLKNSKVNDSELTNFIRYPKAIEKYLAQNPAVDINSRNQYGDTLALSAVKAYDLNTLKVLAERDDFDWNIVDSNGNNVLTHVLSNSDYNSEFITELIKILRQLPSGKFDINHVYYKTGVPYNALISYHAASFVDDIISFPNFNPNQKLRGDDTLLQQYIGYFELFEKLFNHPDADVAALADKEVLNKLKKSDRTDPRCLRLISEHCDKQFAQKIKDIYDENGFLELDEIEKFVNYDALSNIMNTKFNIAGENIVHLLVEIFPDILNPMEIKTYYQILEKLKQADFDFQLTDDLGRTPLDKAIECENEVAIDLLKGYMQ